MRLQAAAGILVVLEVLLVLKLGTPSSVAPRPRAPSEASDPGAAGTFGPTPAIWESVKSLLDSLEA
eukprot:gene1829-33247_t